MTTSTFSALILSLNPLGGRVFDPRMLLKFGAVRIEDVAFGYFLGFLDAASVRDVVVTAAGRGQLDAALMPEFRELAEQDLEQAELLIQQVGEEAIFADPVARRRWFQLSLGLMLGAWESGAGDPSWEAEEFFDAWGEEGRNAWLRLRPRGFDVLVVGKGARRRFLSRTQEFLRSYIHETGHALHDV